MTDKQKAEEIRNDFTKGGYRESVYAADLENALMEMAEWKEQEMIKKACEWLNNNTVTSDNGYVIYTASSHNIDKKTFIEQLKKAMEK